MKNVFKDRIIFIAAVFVAVVIVAGSIYFFVYSQRKQNTEDAFITALKNSLATSTPEQIEASLASAEARLQVATDQLNSMTVAYNRQQASAVALQSGYTSTSDAINKTDILFTNPETSKPQIKLSVAVATQASINLKRQQVTDALVSWKAAIAAAEKDGVISPAENSIVQHDAAVVQSYLADLHTIVESLTPANSGLTQTQIDSYQTIVADAVDQVGTVDPTPDPDSSNNPPPASDNQNPSQNVTPTVPVTQTDIQQQQTVVDQTQTQVNVLQDALNQTQNPPAGDTTATSGGDTGNGGDTTGTTGTDATNTDTGSATDNPNPSGGITPQPGDPQLIQGMNRD